MSLATRTVDAARVLDAQYRFDTVDRRFIDSQIRELQQYAIDYLLNGQTATRAELSSGSAAVIPGDWVVPEANVLGRYTKATSGLLADTGVAAGLVLEACPPGGSLRIAVSGLVPRSVTGLAAGDPGPVRVNTSTGRSQKVVSLAPSDYPLGYVDSQGNLQITRLPVGLGGGGSGNATSIQSVAVNATPPTSGQVLTYSGTEWAPATPSGLSAPFSISGNELRIAASATSPKFYQLDETTNSVNGDALTIQAQNSTGTTTIGGTLILASGTGTTRPGTVQLNFGSTQGLTLDGSGNLVFGVTASAAGTGNMRLPKDYTIKGRNDAGSADVQLLDWGAAADELVLGSDTVAKDTIRSANMLDIYGNGNLLCTFARTPATLNFETISAITYKSTGIFAFHDSGAQRNLGFFTSGSFTTEDKTLYIGTATTPPAGTDNGGSYLWAAGTNGLELRSHTFNGTTSVLGGYMAIGATPSTTTSGANLTNNTAVSFRNAANSANLAALTVNGSDNVTLGYDSGGTNLDVRASSAVRGFSGGVGSFSFGRASGDFLRMGGTGYASTGLIRVVHNCLPIVGLNNAGSADRTVLDWGGTTDTLFVGDAANSASYLRGGSATGFYVGANMQARFLAGNFELQSVCPLISFAAAAATPIIRQTVDATASVTGDAFLINAQDVSGTTAVTGGSMTLRGGDATGGTGTRNGGNLFLRGGNGANTQGYTEIQTGAGTGRIRVDATGIGFFATAPAAQPTVTGLKGGNAALGSLLTGLAALGLVIDSSGA